MKSFRWTIAMGLMWLAALEPAKAQWAVVDAPAIVQLIHQVQTMEQELQTTRAQLTQAQQALATMTGARGMQFLLNGTTRNYLPTSWPQLTGAMQGGSGAYPALSADLSRAVGANAILSPQQLALLTPVNRQQIAVGRQSSALRQALAQEALTNASGRFSSIQTLVNAIGGATDQKGILDLQARISAELGMLQNEQTKLQILQQATEAEDAVVRQQQREQVVAGHGSFSNRFQPAP